MSADKREIRKLVQETYSGIKEVEKKELDHQLSSRVVEFLSELQKKNSFHSDQVLGVYSPLGDEPDWTKVFEDQDFSLGFPYWTGEGKMEFKKALVHELEAEENFGVKMGEPIEAHPTVTPALFLVPGVAFYTDGVRLGRGKGYYDRYLENHNGLKIGLCFEFQILEELPQEDHDVLMDYLVTEKRVICCKSLE